MLDNPEESESSRSTLRVVSRCGSITISRPYIFSAVCKGAPAGRQGSEANPEEMCFTQGDDAMGSRSLSSVVIACRESNEIARRRAFFIFLLLRDGEREHGILSAFGSWRLPIARRRLFGDISARSRTRVHTRRGRTEGDSTHPHTHTHTHTHKSLGYYAHND